LIPLRHTIAATAAPRRGVKMRNMSIITTAATVGLALALPPAERGFAAGAGPFDGAWSVEVDCPDVGDVRGYNWRFSAQVASGVLTSHYQAPTNSGWGA
jgi:hypothetical protein